MLFKIQLHSPSAQKLFCCEGKIASLGNLINFAMTQKTMTATDMLGRLAMKQLMKRQKALMSSKMV